VCSPAVSGSHASGSFGGQRNPRARGDPQAQMTYAAARWQGRGQVGLRWGSTFGKVARASLGPFRQRQFKDRRPFNLTHDPLQAIVWWTVIDTQTLPREVPVCPAKVRPALVYIGGAESETIFGEAADYRRCY
jgi:hypothetical protein